MDKLSPAGTRSFVKMHGLGNDFVIFDARRQPLTLSSAQVRYIADRRFGIGCDQLLVLEESDSADAALRIYNADGTEVGACGNGSRCVAALLFAEAPRGEVTLETKGGRIVARSEENGAVSVDMGAPGLDWRDIGLAEEVDTLALPIEASGLTAPTAVSMGNPHMVFFVDDTDAIDLASEGALLERHPLYPEGANISVAEKTGENRFKLRVWERGAGLTLACGTAACATAIAAARKGLAGRRVDIDLPGGPLDIEWRESDDHVVMSGPVAVTFMGMIEIPAAEALRA